MTAYIWVVMVISAINLGCYFFEGPRRWEEWINLLISLGLGSWGLYLVL